jgi:molybdenum cofactor biosynthesis protein B
VTVHEHRAKAIRARCYVVTVSDTRTEASDTSGHAARVAVAEAGHEVSGYRIIADEPVEVTALIRRLCNEDAADAILLNGGTGIARRDSTHEAVAALLEKRLDGFGELFRMLSYQEIGAAAMLSRAVGGVVGKTLVFSLPGSTGAVKLGLEKLILPELAHLCGELRK